jgi:hypothetical protein
MTRAIFKSAWFLQTATMQPGNSGGALVDVSQGWAADTPLRLVVTVVFPREVFRLVLIYLPPTLPAHE